MVDNHETPKNTNEFPKELLSSFAIFLANEIKSFYESEKGKQYYENWLKKNSKK